MDLSNQKNVQGSGQDFEQKKSQKMLVRIWSIIGGAVGLIIIISIIIGGSLLASKRWDPSWNPFRQKVERKSLN